MKRYGMKLVGYGLAVPLAACTLAVGCKTKPATADDATVAAAVQSRLKSDTGLSGEGIETSVQSGVVTLSGAVSSEAARSLAANDVAEIAGVHTVVNNLALGSSTSISRDVPRANRSTDRSLESNDRKSSAPVERRETARVESLPAPQQSRIVNQPPAPPPLASAPTFRNVTVPVGTEISVRLTETLDSASTQPGSNFSGAIANDVIVDGMIAFPAGTRVTGRVDDAKDAGHFKGNSLLAVSLTGINRRGENIAITTDSFSKEGNGRGKNTAEKIGGGAAVGAILGGIFGGGKGAAIGAGAGGGLGAGAQAVTRGQQVQIPSESLVRFRLTSAVTVRAAAKADGDNGGDLRHHDQ